MKLLSKRIIQFTVLALMFSSCKKDILDINTDPNNPTTTSVTPDLVLPSALATTAAIMNNPTSDNRFAFAGLWMGHISYSGNYAISTENISYNLTNNFGAGTFANLYDNNTDYDFVEQKGKALGNKFYEGIGKLMKAYNYQTLVDLYGNIPYSDALKGTASGKPKYDDQKTIYDDLGRKMDTAVLLFKGAIAGSIGGDIMFNGVLSKWIDFANTVKLRLLLRQSERPERQAYITAEAAKFGASPSFVTYDVTINPGYLNSTGKANPWWGANINTAGTYTQDFYRAGAYLIAFLKAHNDTRLPRFFNQASTGGFQGNFFGEQGLTNSKTSTFGPGILKSAGQNSILMSGAEAYFIQAEAALRGWISGDPQALYQSGVTASFVYLGLTPTDASNYYSQPGDKEVNWTATTTFQEKLNLIIRQKWAALAMINELEPYNDWRRLGLPPDVPLSKSPYSTGKIPARILYPQREYDVNPDNVLAQGAITPNTKIWWMP